MLSIYADNHIDLKLVRPDTVGFAKKETIEKADWKEGKEPS